MKEKAKDLLRYLGCNATYRGYHQTALACEFIEKDETFLLRVTVDLYPKVAEACGCKVDTVERNIRTLIHLIWNEHSDRLIEISRCDLKYPPTVSEFLDFLVAYIQREMMANN